ncbi:unnamed protein product [Lampetra fluviatilis]
MSAVPEAQAEEAKPSIIDGKILSKQGTSQAEAGRAMELCCGALLWSSAVELCCGALLWSSAVELRYRGVLWNSTVELTRGAVLSSGTVELRHERERVQKKTFTKWVNNHLQKVNAKISDLFEDLRDGHNLISLLEVLSGEKLPREKGSMAFHKRQNVQFALEFLRNQNVKLVNIRSDDIVDGNPKLILGLIWTIIGHFQVPDVSVGEEHTALRAEDKLLLWVRGAIAGTPGLVCNDFTSSWRDGRVFCALLRSHLPKAVDLDQLSRRNVHERLEFAFSQAEQHLGVPRILDVEGKRMASKHGGGGGTSVVLSRVAQAKIKEEEAAKSASTKGLSLSEIEVILKNTKQNVGSKAEPKSLWDLLHSEYFSEDDRRKLIEEFRLGKLTLDKMSQAVLTNVQMKQRENVKFRGLRREVSLKLLVDSHIVDDKTANEVVEGSKSVSEITKTIDRYLGSSKSIAGLYIEKTQEKIPLYKAMVKRMLRPGTTLELLEAQAATGFLIDPVNDLKMSVEDAVDKGLVGYDFKDKLLSAERAVTGYTDPVTKKTISLFQAMDKDLILKSHGIRLLEAQIATGGIIDPQASHRLPVEVAYSRGLFDEEMNQILADPSDDTKGFFDPNTEENLTYLELMQRCITDPDTGLCLLPLKEKGNKFGIVSSEIWNKLQNSYIEISFGKFSGKKLSLKEIFETDLIDEATKKQLLDDFRSGKISFEKLMIIITEIIERQKQSEKGRNISFKGLRKPVSLEELVKSKLLDSKTVDQLMQGLKSEEEVRRSIQTYLGGSTAIAGVYIEATKEKMSIYNALKKGYLRPGTSLVLLEAQAATGFIVDPINNFKLSVDEAVEQNVVGWDYKDKLLSAERAVTGYTDPYSKETISLFQAMKKELILKDHGIRLLEAQIATGGIIDPQASHRLPVEVAYSRGLFDEEMNQILSDPNDDTKGFFDPNTQENLTYLDLKNRCITEPETGLCLLPIKDKNSKTKTLIESEMLDTFTKSTVTIKSGKFANRKMSLLEIFETDLVDKERKEKLINDYKTGKISQEILLIMIIEIIETDRMSEKMKNMKFKGLRKQVTLDELFKSKIVDMKTVQQLDDGEKTQDEVGSSILNYLEGSTAIAGLYIEATKEKMSIYNALKKGYLRPGTSLVLLEAQAATGFIVDPINNLKLSVDEAVEQKVVGWDYKDKLLSAERAVTGYTDPYSKETLSLFQAMKKGLILKDHGIRLLEAQIATGGIIDPQASHRLPVEVAYSRGLFDEEMNQILADPSDDTKGFFDPNTEENLTYLDLKQRCIIDPGTGLCLLSLKEKRTKFGNISSEIWNKLQNSYIEISFGKFSGKKLSLKELFETDLIDEATKKQLLDDFRSGKISFEKLMFIITEIIERQKQSEKSRSISFKGLRKPVSVEELVKSKLLDSKTVEQLMQGLKSEEEVRLSIQNYLGGSTAIAGIYIEAAKEKMSIYNALKKGFLRPGTSLILLEAQAATGFIVDPINNLKLSVDEAVEQKVVGWDYKDKLLSAERAVTGYTDPYSKETLSLFQAMKKELILKDHGIRLLEAQIATGGIIDPQASHRLPVEVAYSRGLFDEEMNETLSDPNDDTKGFFDPNTQENLTYLDLKNRCITEPETGLCLLPIIDKNSKTKTLIESEMLDTFTKSTVTIKSGKYANRKMSLLEIFETDLVDKERKEKLINDYKTGKISQEILLIMIIEIIETDRMSEKMKNMKFKGLRKQVTLDELFKSKIVDMKTVQQLDDGEKTQDEVGSSILNYLEGSTAIAGLYIEATKEKMSIYNALKKGYLRPGTSLVLLEAQAATGFIVDPINNLKLSVDEAVEQKVVGWDYKDKLLSAERAVTGYTDPYSKETLSLFQAMKKGLILKDHGIRLLEAQIATGGIIDPQASHRLPVEVAYSRGLFDEEMNQILADPSDDTKGFFDPNTEENLTYLDLKQRCIIDPDTGLCLLSLKEKRTKFGNISSEIWNKLKNSYIEISFGKFSGKKLSLKELFETDLIDEATKKQLLDDFRSGKISFEKLMIIITEIIERQKQSEKSRSISFKGLRKPVSVEELVKSKLLDSKTVEQLMQGLKSEEEVRRSIQNYLGGSTAIAGIYIEAAKEKMSIYNALKKGFLRPGTSLILLEAQAATGFIVDPINNLKLSVDEAVEQKVVGWDYKDKLLSAERAVTGYTDPYSKETLSLFQAMKKELILKDHGIRLLEAQIATGGIIDPQASHRLPVEVAYSRGLFDEEMNEILSDPNDDTKGFFDPNTQENLTYLDLKNRCITEPETGLCLLPIIDKNSKTKTLIESEMLDTFTKSTVTIKSGKFANRKMSLLEIFETDLVDKERKEKLINDYKTGKISQEILLIMIIEIIETDRMSEKMKNMKFKGLRKQVTLDELFKSKIVDMKTVQQLDDGEKTQDEVGSSILNYLEGSTAIAGLYIEATKEKMSIYNALKKGYLRPGTSLVLLEAQAATGFIVDPINNLKLSVDEAVEQKVVGWDYKDKLLSAERAVTGYTDPYSKETLSLFQAMKKGLILKDHGIRLLEAQIATGGIIDPQASHRLPVEVAYSRGLFDEEMNQILADPSDDTKGFFDPNTEENLTYLDLKQRCIIDPDTGLCLLSLKEKRTKFGNISSEIWNKLKNSYIEISFGKFSGKKMSLKELFETDLIDEATKKQLLDDFRSGKISFEKLMFIITEIIERQKQSEKSRSISFKGLRKPVSVEELVKSKLLDSKTVEQLMQGLKSEEEVRRSIQNYLGGSTAIAGIYIEAAKEKMSIYNALKKGFLRPGTSLILLEAQAATGFIVDPINNLKLSVDEAVEQKVVGWDYKDKLLSAERAVTGYTDPYSKETLSLFQAMKKELILKDHGIRLLEAQIATGGIIDPQASHRLPVEVAYSRGLFDEEMNEILSDPNDDTKGFFDPNTQENLTYLDLKNRCITEPETGLCLLPIIDKNSKTKTLIESEMLDTFTKSTVTIKSGKFANRKMSLLEIFETDLVDKERKEKLINDYKTGKISQEILLIMIIEIIETDRMSEKMKNMKFKGLRKQVTLDELFKSKIVDMKTVQQLDDGEKTQDEVGSSILNYLEGSTAIAGLYIEATKEKMSIYNALKKGYLRPGTSLVLLEAQAATGFIVDPINNLKLSVDEAVEQKVVGWDYKDKLLSAERAVTGYTDPYSKETLSLFQAMKKGLILKDHGIRLLEAQIATGGIIDPQASHRLPVEVAYSRGLFDEEMNQILADPSDDTKGFFDPNTEENLTYLDLKQRCIIDPDTGLCLLSLKEKRTKFGNISSGDVPKIVESKTVQSAQIGTSSQTTTITTTTTTTLTEKLMIIITEIIERQKQSEKSRSISTTITTTTTTTLTEVEIWNKLKNSYFEISFGKFSGKKLSLKELFETDLIDEATKKQLLDDFRSGKISFEKLMIIITEIIERQKQSEKSRSISFKGLRKPVSVEELVKSKLLDSQTVQQLMQGLKSEEEVRRSIQNYLGGSTAIAGVYIEAAKEKMSIYNALKKGFLRPGTSLVLLEAQAATGFIVDPINNLKLSVDEAVEHKVVGWDYKDKLLSAERAVTGYTDPYSKETISLFQAMKKGLILKDHGIRLLEAQIATGGIIDPEASHRLPVEVAYSRGLFDEEMNQILSDPNDDTKGFFDPNTQENLTYLDLKRRCITDPDTGLCLLPIKEFNGVNPKDSKTSKEMIIQKTETVEKYAGGSSSENDPFLVESSVSSNEERFIIIESQVLDILYNEKINMTFGRFAGKNVSLKDIFDSDFIDAETREKLIDDYKSGKISLADVVAIVTKIIEAKERTEAKKNLWCRGFRRQVSVAQLVESQVLDDEVANQLADGRTSIQEVTRLVKRYLEGTSSIAGLYLEKTKEKVSVSNAIQRRMLKPESGMALLEAQAATGFIMNPVSNEKLTVHEAVEKGVVQKESRDQLLAAECAVTGYKDPHSGGVLSLFQAMKKGVVSKDHGIHLLEAQIATGGIIDPQASHRLPTNVAYSRGLFDEEMNKTLVEGKEFTKGFFDPNTGEKVTYLDLMKRCITDPDTGLYLFVLRQSKQTSTVVQKRKIIIDPDVGKEMSVYEAYEKGLLGKEQYLKLSADECAWEERKVTLPDGTTYSTLVDKKSGKCYDVSKALAEDKIKGALVEKYNSGAISIFEFADKLSAALNAQ